MRAGVGYANDAAALDAGRRAASDALRQGVTTPDLVLAFCAGGMDAEAFFAGVRLEVGPEAPILGGSAIGVITLEALSYAGAPVAVAALELGGPVPGVAAAGGLDRDERDAGRRLGRALAASGAAASGLLLFYDSIRTPPTAAAPPIMNASRPLLAGLAEAFPGCPPIAGAGVIGDYGFSPTWQFCGDGARHQHAAGVLLPAALRSCVEVMHGCTPMDGVPHVLTRVEGCVVHEIDGRPAAAVVDALYGGRDWREQRPVQRLTLGVPQGGRFEPGGEDGHVNRLITGVMPDGKGIGLFEPDLEDGVEVVFMLRDPALMIDSARARSEAALARLRAAGGRPRFALYVDCAGRAAAYSATDTEEAAEVQDVMARAGVPLLGFYSGVEVAPLRGITRGLDWTGVLLLLGEV